ncbi:MAG: twin-arginine translocase TatA/TatE family subunit [Chloroflexi bacterium]|nr:twin-arginine translocase TatA/TatE family subunit [Chloroflexota bacterium]
MPSLGPWELGLVLVIVVIIFGVGKLPDLGGAVGRGIREFRRSSAGEDAERAPERASEQERKT